MGEVHDPRVEVEDPRDPLRRNGNPRIGSLRSGTGPHHERGGRELRGGVVALPGEPAHRDLTLVMTSPLRRGKVRAMSTVTALDVPTDDGPADALLAIPDGTGRHPAILLYMDAFGLRPRIAEMAGRFADAGYVVLAPNVFHRSRRSPLVDPAALADPANREAVFATVGPLMAALTPGLALRDAASWLAFLAGHERVAGGADGRVGTVGYCMGGRLALRTAAAAPDRVAAVATYHAGGVATDAPDSVHLAFPTIRAQAYLAHADDDGSMDTAQQQRVAEALTAAGVAFTAELYAGAPHGFTMSDTAAYRADAEARHWQTSLDLFARTLR